MSNHRHHDSGYTPGCKCDSCYKVDVYRNGTWPEKGDDSGCGIAYMIASLFMPCFGLLTLWSMPFFVKLGWDDVTGAAVIASFVAGLVISILLTCLILRLFRRWFVRIAIALLLSSAMMYTISADHSNRMAEREVAESARSAP